MTDVTSISHRSEVAKTRRAYALLGLGFILPGSAQALQGKRGLRRLGRFSLGLWIILVLLAIVTVVLALIFRHAMLSVFGSGWVLKIVAICIFAIGTFWTLLTISTWWLARPRQMGTRKGVIFSVIALLLAIVLAVVTAGLGRATWATGGAASNIFGGGGNSSQNAGRYNILVLGSDAGPDRWGVRPDSVNVISVNASTGRTVIFGLPRNLEYVPFPDSSPLHQLYPNGYYCSDQSCLLNAIYLLGEEHASLYPGVANPGIQAMIDAATGITGLSINYYALIDMQGFSDLIDAMGGLTITINEQLKLEPTDGNGLAPGPNQHLDGAQVMIFVRSRYSTSDFDRMQRQRCVMAAMLQQLNPSVVATKFTQLAAASSETATTSVPPSQIGTLVDLALKAKSLPIISVSFTPPLVNTGHPDYAQIQQIVAQTIAQSEALDNPKAAPATTAAPSATSHASTSAPAPASSASSSTVPVDSMNTTTNLDQICSVG